MRSLAVGILETVPQLYLTTSLFALAFDDSNTGTKTLQLLSLGLSAMSMLKLTISLVLDETYRDAVKRGCKEKEKAVVLFLAYPMLSLVFISVCAARVYHAFHCDSHLWNFTTGCVELPE